MKKSKVDNMFQGKLDRWPLTATAISVLEESKLTPIITTHIKFQSDQRRSVERILLRFQKEWQMTYTNNNLYLKLIKKTTDKIMRIINKKNKIKYKWEG